MLPTIKASFLQNDDNVPPSKDKRDRTTTELTNIQASPVWVPIPRNLSVCRINLPNIGSFPPLLQMKTKFITNHSIISSWTSPQILGDDDARDAKWQRVDS